MKGATMERRKAQLQRDVKRISYFMDHYFTFDHCNCNKCCEKRNGNKLKRLINSLWFSRIPTRILTNGSSFDNSYILRELDAVRTKFNRSIKTHCIYNNAGTVCKYCGTAMVISTRNGPSNVCSACLNNYCTQCRFCGKWADQYDKKGNEMEEGFCPKCIAKTTLCPCCQRRSTKKTMVEFKEYEFTQGEVGSGLVCVHCASNFIVCDDCGIAIYRSHIHEYDGSCYCGKCILTHKRLFAWNYIPLYTFVYDKRKESVSKDTLFFGVEIEIERDRNSSVFRNRENLIDQIASVFGTHYIYGKKDGSLTNGFEFVTHPYTWKWYTENKYRFNNLFSSSKLSGFKVSNNCGIHIHLSKKAFTSVQLYKFIDFVNKEKNLNFISKIAGRSISTNGYCKPFMDNCTVKVLAEIAKKKNNLDFHRYTAVNLTLPNTVELRIFKGTMSPNVFFRYQEFAHSLYTFTLENSIKKNSIKMYREFIRANKSIYTNMFNLINK